MFIWSCFGPNWFKSFIRVLDLLNIGFDANTCHLTSWSFGLRRSHHSLVISCFVVVHFAACSTGSRTTIHRTPLWKIVAGIVVASFSPFLGLCRRGLSLPGYNLNTVVDEHARRPRSRTTLFVLMLSVAAAARCLTTVADAPHQGKKDVNPLTNAGDQFVIGGNVSRSETFFCSQSAVVIWWKSLPATNNHPRMWSLFLSGGHCERGQPT